VKKDSDNTNKNADNSSLLDSLSKVPQTRRQVKKSSSNPIEPFPVSQ
jgi:E3 ubiquitin-protein ligase DRIP